MTIITGHNQIIQHAGNAQELAQQNQTPKPSAEAAVPVRQQREIQQRSSVQSSEESTALKKDGKGQDSRQERERKKRKSLQEQDRRLDPDGPGRLLDTVI